ncbi:MAG: carboxymuconolactone decarboxylase family protein [Actinomycetes bacterium]
MTAAGSTASGDGAPSGLPSTEQIRSAYVALMGTVPASIETRLALAEQTGRQSAVATIEALRHTLIMDNPLGDRVGQLVHFAQLVALGRPGPARLHARAARRAGAPVDELVGVAELALITAGMPAYSLGVDIIAELVAEEQRGEISKEISNGSGTGS